MRTPKLYIVLEGMEALKFLSITLLSVFVGFGRKLLLGMLDYSMVSKKVKKFLPAVFLLGLTLCVCVCLFTGMANTVGTMGAIISTIGIGYFIQWLGSFQAFLTLTSIMYILSTLFWNLYATGERVIE